MRANDVPEFESRNPGINNFEFTIDVLRPIFKNFKHRFDLSAQC